MPTGKKNGNDVNNQGGRPPVIDKDKLTYLVKASLTDDEIAASFKVTRTTIVKARQRLGIESMRRREATKIDEQTVIRLARAGWTDEKIASCFAVTRKAVQEARKRLGIKPSRYQGQRGA